MASCQTWATSSHFRHPWFDTAVMKRKHRETVSPEDDDDGPSPPPGTAFITPPSSSRPPPKRRRCSVLEHGFAYMSIANATDVPMQPLPMSLNYPHVEDVSPLAGSSSQMDADVPIAYSPPYVVEEPTIPEVKMKTSSWYEPERDRIVITDLDSFTESDDEREEAVTINPVFLERIRTKTFDKPAPSTSQALVLFKPLPGPGEWKPNIVKEEAKREVVDEDAMDVEP
ncbi:hypothetical protein B0H34DRAFT_795850 [Crassisporium funariophilum]|nr:hypothetical protein B0H34DRAFT_795850 [Crassisporium funariophilum]